MPGQEKHCYKFGPFLLDPAERLLTRAGKPVPLTPKAYETLLVLIQNNGHLVEKDELLKRVWPETFVEESTLSQNIFTLRKVLGDTPEGHEYIQTVPRHGYRFVAEVAQVGDGLGRRDAVTQHGASSACHPKGKRNVVRVVVGGAVLVFLAVVALILQKRQRQSPVERLPSSSAMSITRLTHTGKCVHAVISPDGKYMVHAIEEQGRQGLWVAQLATNVTLQVVPPGEGRFEGLTVSHDSNWIYYQKRGDLYRLPLLGGAPRKLVTDVDSPATLSPDDSKLAYVREDLSRGESALIIVNSDGTGEKKLAVRRLPDYFQGIDWSPNGKLIASAVGSWAPTENYMTLVTVAVENGAEKMLTARRWAWVGRPAWLFDGRELVVPATDQPPGRAPTSRQLWRVAYPGGELSRITNDVDDYQTVSITTDSRTLLTVQEKRASNIWIMSNGDAGRPKEITTGDSQDDRPRWTRDGKIVYESLASRHADIWIMDADGSHRKQLTADSGNNFMPAASPDLRHLVFVSDRAGVPNIWRMDLDGSDPVRLTQGLRDLDPYVSPDSRWVVYTGAVSGRPSLWKVSINGGKPERLIDKLSRSPAISPQGTQIAFYYWDEQPDSPTQIAVMPFSGGPAVRKFDTPANFALCIRWTPDGRALSYDDNRGGSGNIWIRPLDGRHAQQVVALQAGQIFSFDWSPDGRHVAFSGGTVSRDAVLITGF